MLLLLLLLLLLFVALQDPGIGYLDGDSGLPLHRHLDRLRRLDRLGAHGERCCVFGERRSVGFVCVVVVVVTPECG